MAHHPHTQKLHPMPSRQEREQRHHDMEQLATGLVAKVNECVSALDEERTERMESGHKSMRQAAADLQRLQERLEAVSRQRAAEAAGLRGEIREVIGSRSDCEEKFKVRTLAHWRTTSNQTHNTHKCCTCCCFAPPSDCAQAVVSEEHAILKEAVAAEQLERTAEDDEVCVIAW